MSPISLETSRTSITSSVLAWPEELRDASCVSLFLRFEHSRLIHYPQAKTVVAPLDRVKILFQASNPDFQKYAGGSESCRIATCV